MSQSSSGQPRAIPLSLLLCKNSKRNVEKGVMWPTILGYSPSFWGNQRQLVTSHPQPRGGSHDWSHASFLVLISASTLTQFRDLYLGTVPPTFRLGFSTSTNTTKTSFSDMLAGRPDPDNPSLRLPFYVIVGCIKLTNYQKDPIVWGSPSDCGVRPCWRLSNEAFRRTFSRSPCHSKLLLKNPSAQTGNGGAHH